jgi:hypothetical protein
MVVAVRTVMVTMLGRRRGCTFVQVNNLGDLPALGPLNDLANDDRPLRRLLASALTKTGDVQ